jgi:hypothetical protein
MTPIETVYEAFLAKINDDEWVYWSENDTKRDLKQIFDAALPLFKFPKKDMTLERESITEKVEDKEVVYYNYSFVSDLSNDEIQILACYMKCEWLNRSILTWERIKP